MGEWQSGQLQRAVNPFPSGYDSSNLSSPTRKLMPIKSS